MMTIKVSSITTNFDAAGNIGSIDTAFIGSAVEHTYSARIQITTDDLPEGQELTDLSARAVEELGRQLLSELILEESTEPVLDDGQPLEV